MIRVAIVAAVPALRAGLRAMLEVERICVVQEAPSLADLGRSSAEVLVVAGASPSWDAGWAWRGPPGEAPAALFLVEDLEAGERLLSSMVSFPVYGVLFLETPAESLRAAVQALAEGLIVIDPRLMSGFEARSMGIEEPGEPLTPRELEILRLLAEGLANKEIAARLGIRERTVKFHISSIYRKLNVVNRAEAVRHGLRRGLITL
ncbi:MAG: response regulator transcription factor [Thermoflexus sp.]|jgi:DNA-binding NarL/FixJ family response regulator|nr:response regulator transcription factor [Thermoflexus sp.]